MGGHLAGGDGVRGGRLQAGPEKGAWTQVREGEGYGLSRSVRRMDLAGGCSFGLLSFCIPGRAKSGRARGVCVSRAWETVGP